MTELLWQSVFEPDSVLLLILTSTGESKQLITIDKNEFKAHALVKNVFMEIQVA